MCTNCVVSPSTSNAVVDAPSSKEWTRKFAVLPVLVANSDGIAVKIYFDWYEVLELGEWDNFHRYRRLPGSFKAYLTHEVGW